MLVAYMLDQRTVVFLTSANGSAKLEEHDAVCTVSHRLITPQTHNARTLECIIGLPILLTRRLLHQHERSAALKSAHEVMRHGGKAKRGVCGRVVIPGDDIYMLGPFEIIERFIGTHHIRCNRNIGGMLLDGIILQFIAV